MPSIMHALLILAGIYSLKNNLSSKHTPRYNSRIPVSIEIVWVLQSWIVYFISFINRSSKGYDLATSRCYLWF